MPDNIIPAPPPPPPPPPPPNNNQPIPEKKTEEWNKMIREKREQIEKWITNSTQLIKESISKTVDEAMDCKKLNLEKELDGVLGENLRATVDKISMKLNASSSKIIETVKTYVSKLMSGLKDALEYGQGLKPQNNSAIKIRKKQSTNQFTPTGAEIEQQRQRLRKITPNAATAKKPEKDVMEILKGRIPERRKRMNGK